MRDRKFFIGAWLSEQENKRLERMAEKSGLSVSVLLRKLIAGEKITEKPSQDYLAIKHELSAIGNNLNQLARHANTFGEIDRTEFKAVHDDLQKLWLKVRDS